MSKTVEEWRPVVGYEGLYEVSDLGRVKSLDRVIMRKNGRPITVKGKIKEPTKWNYDYDYLEVKLSKNGVDKTIFVHQLVAKTFIPNPNGCDVVHHIDRNQKNNRVDNLEWMTKPEHDALHYVEYSKRVDQIDCITGEILYQFASTQEVERELGYDHRSISQCCNGGYKHKGKWHDVTQAYGYVWKYIKKS